jgi:hypothetical protein
VICDENVSLQPRKLVLQSTHIASGKLARTENSTYLDTDSPDLLAERWLQHFARICETNCINLAKQLLGTSQHRAGSPSFVLVLRFFLQEQALHKAVGSSPPLGSGILGQGST